MSSFVKDLTIPKCCMDCLLCDDCTRCDVTGSYITLDMNARLSNCPIIPIPKTHGKLVDMDEVKQLTRSYFMNNNQITDFLYFLDMYVKAIIPEEKEDKK